MKNFLILLVSASLFLFVAPAQADDNKKRRISGVKSSQHADRHTERRRDTRRSDRRADRRSDRRSDRRVTRHRSTRDVINRHRNYGNHGHRSSYRGHYRNHYPRRHYNSHYPRYRYSRYNYNRHNYLLGGVLLGAALNNHRHTVHCDHDEYYRSSYPQQSRVVTTRVIREGTYGRGDEVHLFRDRDGNCFEVTENRNGDEVRSEIDPSYCEW